MTPSNTVSSARVESEAARSQTMRQIADGLIALGEVAGQANVQILLETHGDFSASPPCEDVMRRINHPSVGLVWDTHHPWRFHGERVADTFERLRPWDAIYRLCRERPLTG